MTSTAAPDPGNDTPDEVWTLADDPDDEDPVWGADDLGIWDRAFRR